MTPEERALIDGLFDRMRGIENQPRDAEAEALIARRLAEAPHAPYALAQTVLVQEHALQQAYARVQELEAQARAAEERAPQSSGGFLGGLFGGTRPSVPSAGGRAASAPSYGQQPMGVPPGYGQQPGYAQQGQPPGPWGQQAAPQRGGFGGGGFLQGALATAAGVAGGALLYDGIKNMMAGGGGPVAQAAAAELPKSDAGAGGTDLGSDAQNALGGQPAAEENFWNADQGQDQGQDFAQDDGGDWGGDDDGSWA
ncbi:DUF2076 domain-containing protein [Xanthobacter pseudotagetidis]|uniref:DUF2076 domain-containing protein n=1 Tax=Xanthobacter pseudotagetidis TaxID=3119911 RepID=UPI00372910C4